MRDDENKEQVRAACTTERPRRALPLVLLLALAASCSRDRAEEKPARDAPWRVEEATSEDEPLPTTTYRVAPGQSLELSLPAQYASPRGVLRGLSGEIHFHPARLSHATGRVEVDLSRLEMLEAAPEELGRLEKKRTESAEEARRTLAALRRRGTWTEQARRWLASPPTAKSDTSAVVAPRATFTLEFARDLSFPRASAGARRKPKEGEGEIRIVDATLQGELALRGFSVERSFPVRLAFRYSEAAKKGDLPDTVEVSFRRQFRVPLAEYDVRPRDPRGVVVATIEDQVSRLVGSTARVTGSLEFRRVTR